jgi:Ca-activated chloride channel family protein
MAIRVKTSMEKTKMTDALQLSSQCSRSAVQILPQSQLVYVLTEIFPLANTAGQRLPLNFVLLLDHSGSMAGDKIRTMKLAVNRMVEQLTPQDILSIVTFETRTEVLVPAGAVVDKEELINKIERIQDAGGTNLAPALVEGLNQISEFQSADFINRMILLTDGEATDREDDSRAQADLAGKY